MWNLWSRIVPAKKRKKFIIEVGNAYDINGQTMVVSTVSRGTDDIGVLLVSVETYWEMKSQGLTYDYRRQP